MRVVEATQTNSRAHGDAVGSVAAQSPQAAVVGVGLATPLGVNARETWEALLRGEFVKDHALVPQTWPAGRARVIELALQTAREAAASARWDRRQMQDDATALIVATSKGPIEAWMPPLLHMDASPYVVGGLHPEGLGEIAAVLGRELGLGCGARLTLSAACASGLHALIRGSMLIRFGQYRRVLVVAAESSIHPLFLGSFQRLGILARPGYGCRPFDRHREGFLMSEAAAAVCLEAHEQLRTDQDASYSDRGNGSALFVDRCALGGDATHLTGSDPDATTLKRLLRQVIGDWPIDLVHAHGTATQINDQVELAAIESSLGDAMPQPLLYSHKGALGHSLGASGMVSVVLNALAHRYGVVPPNGQTREPLTTSRVRIANSVESRPIHRSIAAAAGFGGSVAVVSLSSRVP